MSEEDNIYVSSRGLLKSTDYHSITPYSSIKRLVNYPNLNNLKALINITNKTPLIYICSSAIPHFINTLFPLINFKFILLSGDCDEDIPKDIFKSNEEFNKFIDNDNIIHWFCQNWIGGEHNKVSIMPIGMDYHTMNSANIYWGPKTNPVEQENILLNIKQKIKPFWDRKIKCYSNFHFALNTKHGYDRRNAINEIPKELIYYEEKQVERLKSWMNQSEYAFIISPHGGGYDCHRLWEGLNLGCIPIVKTSKIDKLYDELPVLIVKEWSDINEELLIKTINEFKKKKFNYDRLTLQYWINKINSYA